jgi:hypothetical protein
MLVYKDSNLIDLLIFGCYGNTAVCFNAFVKFDQDVISLCTKKLFKELPSIQKVNVSASYSPFKRSILKAVLHSKANEYIIDLTSTVDEYFLQLGHSTRKSVRNHKSKLLRDFPGVNFITKYGNEIEESVIDRIIQLNIARMQYKGIIPAKDDSFAKKMFKYCKHYGAVTYIEIDGVIVAGDIAYILNNRMLSEVIAHDNKFSAYNLGEICMVHMIQTAINRGLQTLYLSWGENEYKTRLLAKPNLLYSYIIYRTYSLSYIINTFKSPVLINLTRFRLSKYSKPIRDAIKTYRKRKWTTQESGTAN